MGIKEIFIFTAYFYVLCAFGSTVDIQCEYGTDDYYAVGSVYQCVLQNNLNIKSRESAVINSVSGSHLSGKSNSDVTCFYSRSSGVIEYFPRNLDNIFKNLKMILIAGGRLKEIQQNDLRPFTKLVLLNLGENDIEFLEDGLFAYNPELAVVSFEYNKIIHIGSHVFENLNKLTWLYLRENKCINMYAYNNTAEVRKVISQAKLNCSNSDFLTIDNKLSMLEDKLFCANSEALPVLKQNLRDLQNSKLTKLGSFRDRFESLNTWKVHNYESVKDKISTIESSVKNVKIEVLGLNGKISTVANGMSNLDAKISNLSLILEEYIKANINISKQIQPESEDVSGSSLYFKVIIITSCAVTVLINTVLVIIYQKIKTE